MVAVGGSKEVVHARPGDYHIILKNRKGFVKLAIQTGTSLVPVFAFGENDIYDQPVAPDGSLLKNIQAFLKSFSGITPPIINGRGFFQHSFGLVPRSNRITTVVGAPIDIVKNETPTIKQIDDVHEQFVMKLTKLFNDQKIKHSDNSSLKLIIE